MTKLAGILLAVAALAVALCLVAARRPVPAPRAHGALGARFWALVAGLVALLGGATAAADPPAPPRAGAASQPESGARLADRAEWRQIRERWLGVARLERVGYDALEKTIAAHRAENRKLLDRLVAAKLVGAAGAAAFNDVYADRIYHKLRASAATCYDPTELGHRVMLTREGAEKRLGLIADLARKGTLAAPVALKVQAALQRQLEVIARINELWARQKARPKARPNDWDAYRKEEAEILALFATGQDRGEIKDDVAVRPGLVEAMRLIQLLYVPAK